MKTAMVSANMYLAQQSVELGVMMFPFFCALLVVTFCNYKGEL